MNTPDIDTLPAGPDLDALVAEKVMGWTLGDPHWIHGYMMHGMVEVRTWLGSETEDGAKSEGWSPSTNIAAAWEVVEKLSQSGVDFYLERDPYGRTHWARFNDTTQGTYNKEGCEDKRLGDADAPTAPLAICRAALKAIHA